MSKKTTSYPTRFSVGVFPDCWCRSCMWPGVNKGSFTQGFGYTSYFKEPKPVCNTNHLHGCPNPLPEPTTENARCCYRPSYKGKGTAPTGWQTCDICGAYAPKGAAKELNALPTLPGVKCKHVALRLDSMQSTFRGWYQCLDCLAAGLQAGNPTPKWAWDHRPQPFEEPQFTTDDQIKVLEQRWSANEKGSSKPPLL